VVFYLADSVPEEDQAVFCVSCNRFSVSEIRSSTNLGPQSNTFLLCTRQTTP